MKIDSIELRRRARLVVYLYQLFLVRVILSSTHTMAPVFVLLFILGATSAAADLTSVEVESVSSGSFRSQTFELQAAAVRRAVEEIFNEPCPDRASEQGKTCSGTARASVAMGDFSGYRWSLTMRSVDADVIAGLDAQPLSDEVEEMAVRFGVHLQETGGSSAKRRRKHETMSRPSSDVVRLDPEHLDGYGATARFGATLNHLADLSDSSAVSVHVEAWTRLADAPNARRVRVHLQGKTTSRDPSSPSALRSDAVTVTHLLESDTTRTVARALAPSSDPVGFRRGQVGVDLSSMLGRGEADGEVVPFPDVDAAFLADADWTLEKPRKGDRKGAVEATMVLSEASWSDFQDLLAYLTVARMYDLDGDGDGGDNGAMSLEDLLRAFEFADGRHRTWEYSPFGAFPFAAGLLPSSSETAVELLVIVTAGAWLALTGWFCAGATKPLWRTHIRGPRRHGTWSVGVQVAIEALFAPVQAAWMLVVIPCDAVLLVVETVATFAIDLVSSLVLVFDSRGFSADADMLAIGGGKGSKKRQPASAPAPAKRKKGGKGGGSKQSQTERPSKTTAAAEAATAKLTAARRIAAQSTAPAAVSEDELFARRMADEAELLEQRLHAEARMRERTQTDGKGVDASGERAIRKAVGMAAVSGPAPPAPPTPAAPKSTAQSTMKTVPKPRPRPLIVKDARGSMAPLPQPSVRPPPATHPPLPPNPPPATQPSRFQTLSGAPPLPTKPPPPNQPRRVHLGAPPGFPARQADSVPLSPTGSAISARSSEVDVLGGTQWADVGTEMREQETLVAKMLEDLTSTDSPNPTVHPPSVHSLHSGPSVPPSPSGAFEGSIFGGSDGTFSLWGSTSTSPMQSPLTSPKGVDARRKTLKSQW